MSDWTLRARRVIADVIADCRARGVDPKQTLKEIDAAYPFGPRKHWPYQAWLGERRKAIARLVTMPSADEVAACMLARDMLEDDDPADLERVKALLDAQAPNRLARRCPGCSAPSGCPCVDLESADEGGRPGRFLMVPHEARLVGHVGAGPLFEGR